MMKNHVYKLIELAGTSNDTIEDAVNTAVERTNKRIKTCVDFKWWKSAGASRMGRWNTGR